MDSGPQRILVLSVVYSLSCIGSPAGSFKVAGCYAWMFDLVFFRRVKIVLRVRYVDLVEIF